MARGRTLSAIAFSTLFLTMLQGFGSPASAHPHVWVTVEADIVYDADKRVEGFRHKWTFDEFYSSFAIQGLDKNQDGIYDREELHVLAEINVESLKDFDYFTFPKVSEDLLERLPPRDYWLEYRNAQLTLYMTIPLAQALPPEQVKDMSLGIYDPTFYVDFKLAAKQPITLEGAPDGCQPVIVDPVANDSQLGVSTLSEAFFESLDATSTFGESIAKKISISCPAS